MDFEIHPNRRKLAWMTVFSFLFTVTCFFVAVDQDLNVFKRAVLGFGGGLFFGVCFYFALVKLVSKTASLSIGEDGIRDNTSMLQVGLILWEDIVSIQIVEISKQHFLGVEVREAEKYLCAMNPLARLAANINKKMYGYAILFPQSLIAIPLTEVIIHIEQRLGFAATRNPVKVNPHPALTVLELLL